MLLLLTAVAVFALQNPHLVTVNLLGWEFHWPLAGVVLVTVAAGALLVFLVGLVRQVGLSLRMRDAAGRLRRVEVELGSARAESEKAKGELTRARVALAEKDRTLVALRAELATANHQLEEVRKRAVRTNGAGGVPEGGGFRGSGARRV